MRIIYRLSDSEIDNVELTVEKICDRQLDESVPLSEYMKGGVFGGFTRFDMFWIGCNLDGVNLGSLCIDPHKTQSNVFFVRQNHCKVEPLNKLTNRVAIWFQRQPAYEQQKQWVQQINDKVFAKFGGYDGYLTEQKRLIDEWMNQKKACCRKYAAEIQDYLENRETREKRTELDKLFREENVYLNTPIQISGFKHIIWVYNNYVKGK